MPAFSVVEVRAIEHCRQGRGRCFRLGEESLRVIDHMNAIGAPFAREYGTPTGAITAGVDRIGSN